MLAYRVFAYLPSAGAGEPGHPLYAHRPQRGGRIDHPDYFVWYLAGQPQGAVGETFGNLAIWDLSMFDVPFLPGGRRALGVYRLPDTLRLLDLDDPAELLQRNLRPSQVVIRNLAVTQAWGHQIFSEPDPHDHTSRRWDAVGWWSYHHPRWTILGCWDRPELAAVEDLSLLHPAVLDAAAVLRRPVS